MILIMILFSSIALAIAQYIDKHLANIGTSKTSYFYYTCLTMIPFASIMVLFEYFTNQLRFEFNIISFLLLIIAMIFRYLKQHTVMGCLKYLNPYEDSSYLSLSILIAFIIDIGLGIESLKMISVLSILFTLIGVFCIANSKLKIKNLQKDLLIRIFTTLVMSYTTHFILKYWSNAVFMLVLNLSLVILFAKGFHLSYHQQHRQELKWCLCQQIFGFSSLYLSNWLASRSVTLSTYVKPTSILIVFLISLFLKDNSKKPSIHQIIGILLVCVGILLINV